MRLFIAIDPPEEVVDYAGEIQKSLKQSELFKGSYPKRENIHLTILFLGEVNDEDALKIQKKLSEKHLRSARVDVIGIEADNPDRPKTVWLAVESAELEALFDEISDLATQPIVRPLRFHITLARVKSIRDSKGLIAYLRQIPRKHYSFTVRELKLKKSESMPEGHVYIDLLVKSL